MKKTIAILLVLVLAGVGLFATDLLLTTSVSEKNLFKISGSDYSSQTFNDAFSSTELTGDVVTTRVVDIDTGIDTTYLTMGTNSTTGFTVKFTSASQLASPTVLGTPIDYTITCNGKSIDTVDNDPIEIATLARATGQLAKIVSYPITVAMDAETFYNAAEAGDYTATVVFEIGTV